MRRSTHLPSVNQPTRIRPNWPNIAAAAGTCAAVMALILGSWAVASREVDRRDGVSQPETPPAVTEPADRDALWGDVDRLPAPLGVTPDPLPDGSYVFPPCVTEDDDDCYWDAARQGNGRGESWISWGGEIYRAVPAEG